MMETLFQMFSKIHIPVYAVYIIFWYQQFQNKMIPISLILISQYEILDLV